MKKVFVSTLGCKVNQYESAAFKAGFEAAGFQIVTRKEPADLVVINSCAVTESAGSQSRQTVRQALRKNPDARIIITGCYAEIGVAELTATKDLKDRDYYIVGNSQKDKIVTIGSSPLSLDRETETNTKNIILGTVAKAKEICRLPVKRFGERSRAYLRIQDGCESFCTYCIVPYTRGPSRSLPVSEVVDQAVIFEQEGHKEIVLTGIHIGYYGKDLKPGTNIVHLLDELSAKTPQVSYRVSSLEPLEITDDLLRLMQERSNIQPHLHIPLQSGNDEVLARMNRRYSIAQFKEVVERCHQYLPDCAIGIDILAGFPGETSEQFKSAKTFLKSLDFTYLHVFPYSIRPGTVAADFPNQITKKEKEVRVSELLQLSEKKKLNFYKKQLGQSRTLLIEGRRNKDGLLKGFTDNYVAVQLDGPDELLNSVCKVKLIEIEKNIVIGERCTAHED